MNCLKFFWGLEMGATVRLIIDKGALAGQQFEFRTRDTLIFGRSKRNCHISLPYDNFISRHHFIMEINPPEVQIRDLGSRNGTFINKKKYGGRPAGAKPKEALVREFPSVSIIDGDRIQVGKTHFKLEIERQDTVRSATVDLNSPHQAPTKQMQVVPCAKCSTAVSIESSQVADLTKVICDPCKLNEPNRFRDIRQILHTEDPRKSSLPELPGYQILKKLGRGGMGTVYAAICVADQTKVAIKTIAPTASLNPNAQQEFLRECEVLYTLDHPNIVKFIDLKTVDSIIYCVMEYCNGGHLANRFAKRGTPISVQQLSGMFLLLLDALSFAHQKGYVHRDIKPENILLQRRGRLLIPKLADFGLAKNYQTAGFSGMTVTGSFAGTCNFMPREQLTNFKYVDPRSDIWSLAASFYYLATGHFPRERSKGEDPIHCVLSKEITPIQRRKPEISNSIARVIDKALSATVDNRYQNSVEFARALRSAKETESLGK